MESASCPAVCLTISVVIFTILEVMITLEMLEIQRQEKLYKLFPVCKAKHRQAKALRKFIKDIRSKCKDYDDFLGYSYQGGDYDRVGVALNNSSESDEIAINFAIFLIFIGENYQVYKEVLCRLVKNEDKLSELNEKCDIYCTLTLLPEEFRIPSEFRQLVFGNCDEYQLEFDTVVFLVFIAIHLVLRVPDIGKKIEYLTPSDVIETFFYEGCVNIYDSQSSLHYMYNSFQNLEVQTENEDPS